MHAAHGSLVAWFVVAVDSTSTSAPTPLPTGSPTPMSASLSTSEPTTAPSGTHPRSPCVCQPYWWTSDDGGSCDQVQNGCPAVACEGGNGNPWCMVMNSDCDGHEVRDGGGWAYCDPPSDSPATSDQTTPPAVSPENGGATSAPIADDTNDDVDAAAMSLAATVMVALAAVAITAVLLMTVVVRRRRRLSAKAMPQSPDDLEFRPHGVGFGEAFDMLMRSGRISGEGKAEVVGRIVVWGNEDIAVHEQIGVGQFGNICRATLLVRTPQQARTLTLLPAEVVADQDCQFVAGQVIAVKTAKASPNDTAAAAATMGDFLNEALITARFRHPNVITLMGICQAPAMLCLEFCENGSLVRMLRDSKAAGTLRLEDMLAWLHGIALGMQYLASCHFVHRDLAARNVLLDKARVAKIADFGLSRLIDDSSNYYHQETRGIPAPIRWMAKEAFNDYHFSEKSDVYSFGVTADEIFSGGERPWGNCPTFSVMELVTGGHTMPRQPLCPEGLYASVLAPCLKSTPQMRPTFALVVTRLEDVLNTEVRLNPTGQCSKQSECLGYTILDDHRPADTDCDTDAPPSANFNDDPSPETDLLTEPVSGSYTSSVKDENGYVLS